MITEELTEIIRNLTQLLDRVSNRVHSLEVQNEQLKKTAEDALSQLKEVNTRLMANDTVLKMLNGCGGKIEAIKIVKAFTNMNLRDAKDFVETHTIWASQREVVNE